MSVHVHVFRGQGVKIGDRFATIHRFVSPKEILVRFREGFETVTLDHLLPVVALESVAKRFEETENELELSNPVHEDRDGELEPELSDEGPLEGSDDSQSKESEKEFTEEFEGEESWA